MDGAWPWIIGFIALWLIFGKSGRAGTRCRHRRARQDRPAGASPTGKGSGPGIGEVDRLREELAGSQAQVAALTARLEVLETIITDEERALRREFRELERAAP